MEFRRTTVLGLFDSSQKHFIIPVYQRAYSWDEAQWSTFLSDLSQQIASNNSYYYGNILLETVKKDIQYEVIDGQQRLTTLSIFIRCLLEVLKDRKDTESAIDLDFDSKEKIYFKNGGNIKLRVVEYDRACFEALIIDDKEDFNVATPSQERIKRGKKYFFSALSKMETTTLQQIFDKLESTEVNCIELAGKKQSALMFELQNNRGKDLTNMEKIKSFFMYQIYICSPAEETETNIESISNIFKLIYLLVNDLKTPALNEDSVLIYHCNAFFKEGFNYRSIEDIKEVYARSEHKVKWIKDFVSELHCSFSSIKKMENSNLPYLVDLRKLSIPAFIYPFIIKGYKYHGESDNYMNKLYNILEVVVFRYRLINSRADLISRLNEILIGFNGDLESIKNHFKKKLNDALYWGDSRTKEYLNGYMYENRALNYLLWKYEDSLKNRGYGVGSISIENEQIEHISPQKPTNGEAVASGYDVNEKNEYSEEFIEKHLNSVGNLVLISASHNASIGNRPFSEKLNSYLKDPLLRQQSEIAIFTGENKSRWGILEIEKRQQSIVEGFAIPKWNFDNIAI